MDDEVTLGWDGCCGAKGCDDPFFGVDGDRGTGVVRTRDEFGRGGAILDGDTLSARETFSCMADA